MSRISSPSPAFNFPTFSFSLPSFPHIAATTLLSTTLFLTPQPTRAFPIPSSSQSHPSNQSHPSSPKTDPEHTFAEEVLSLIDRYYLDRTFNSTSWPVQQEKILHTSLSNHEATYSVLRKSILTLNDRYTRLLSPSEMEALRRFDVSGVGLLLTSDARGNLVVATTPAKGTAAEKAGILRGDVLLSIDGVSIIGEPAFKVSELMQGRTGTDMNVEFRDRGTATLKRGFVEDKPSLVEKYVKREDGDMGYIRLKEFRASGREEVGDAARRLTKQGAEWIVLDLRGNGGGVFEGALEIAGLFEGGDVPVARVLGRGDGAGGDMPTGDEIFMSRLVGGEERVENSVDLAIVVDGGSASSSEVLAGGLRDACRAALVGENTYGKGLIQGVFGLPDGGGLVITVAEYRTPKGERIQGVGLKPDVENKVEGLAKFGKFVGVERLDETTVNLSRAQVREAVKMCEAKRSLFPVEK